MGNIISDILGSAVGKAVSGLTEQVKGFLNVKDQLSKAQSLLMSKVGEFMQNGAKLDAISKRARALLSALPSASKAPAEALVQRTDALITNQTNLVTQSTELLRKFSDLKSQYEGNAQVQKVFAGGSINVSALSVSSAGIITSLMSQGVKVISDASKFYTLMENQTKNVNALDANLAQAESAAKGSGIFPSVDDIISNIKTPSMLPVIGVIAAAGLAFIFFRRKR